MRLRVFDLNTPWFWLVVFFQRTYGQPWLQLDVYSPHTWKKWWINVWQWEKVPDARGAYAATTTEEAHG